VRRAAEPVGVGGFEIGYVTDDGLEHRVSLSQAWATPFESCSPIRRFTSHQGQRHLSGLWWERSVSSQDRFFANAPADEGSTTGCKRPVVSAVGQGTADPVTVRTEPWNVSGSPEGLREEIAVLKAQDHALRDLGQRHHRPCWVVTMRCSRLR
jgi:hypothetical protein